MNYLLDENGQGVVEYALIVALISIVAIVALVMLARVINDNYYNKVANALNNEQQ
jgi:pilus assembly protein Flp/PilA